MRVLPYIHLINTSFHQCTAAPQKHTTCHARHAIDLHDIRLTCTTCHARHAQRAIDLRGAFFRAIRLRTLHINNAITFMGKHFTNDQLKTYIDRLLVACPVLEDLKLVHGLFFCVVRLYLSLQSISGYKDLTLSFPLSSLPQYLNCS